MCALQLLAPIVLFVYNRPEHTGKTVEALVANDLALESDLFVFSDGPKKSEDEAQVLAVRKYIRGIAGFKSVTIVERTENFGLSRSITTGVTDIVSTYGRVVVLEDDIVTAPFFLKFMNDALCKYEDYEQVMHIAGYMFPIDPSGLKETLFYRVSSCWGWGTWKRAWDRMETDASKLKENFPPCMKYRFNIDGRYDSWSILDRHCRGVVDSWDIVWYASVFLLSGLCLHPARSLTKNIGHDGSGIHCPVSDMYNVNVYEGRITEFEDVPTENSLALKRIKRYLFRSRIPSMKRVINRFRNMFKNLCNA
jgi:GT2 family glycosyltransferase